MDKIAGYVVLERSSVAAVVATMLDESRVSRRKFVFGGELLPTSRCSIQISNSYLCCARNLDEGHNSRGKQVHETIRSQTAQKSGESEQIWAIQEDHGPD